MFKGILAQAEQIHIAGRRWFQKSVGNTYHTVTVSAMIDGVWQDVYKSGIRYGYGEQFIVTAAAGLIESGLLDSDDSYVLHHWHTRKAHNVEISVVDVARKRDL